MDYRGNLIRRRRDELGWTIGHAATACGVSIGSMSLLENGKMPNASFNIVAKVALGLGLKLEDMIEPETAQTA